MAHKARRNTSSRNQIKQYSRGMPTVNGKKRTFDTTFGRSVALREKNAKGNEVHVIGRVTQSSPKPASITHRGIESGMPGKHAKRQYRPKGPKVTFDGDARGVGNAAGALTHTMDKAADMAKRKGKYKTAEFFNWAGFATSVVGSVAAIVSLFNRK